MQIEPANPEDADAIASVHVRSWRIAYERILAAEYLASLSVEQRASRWRDILVKRESNTLVVRRGSDVLGFVSHGKCRDKDAPTDQGEIWALYVDPGLWQQGAGRSLLNRALEDLQGAGFRAVSLWVFSRNQRGRTFYEKHGFQPMPETAQTFELGGLQVEELRYLRAKDA